MQQHVPFTAPRHLSERFNCPFCHAYATQEWGKATRESGHINYGYVAGLSLCRCAHCRRISIWQDGRMVFPAYSPAPPAAPDLPDALVELYEEARMLVERSHRAAAAILRLVIQKLCIHLGEAGEDLEEDIESLTNQGLPVKIQDSLALVKVIGENAVAPGQIDEDDTPEIAMALFGVINLLVADRITHPKQMEELYTNLVPEGGGTPAHQSH